MADDEYDRRVNPATGQAERKKKTDMSWSPDPDAGGGSKTTKQIGSELGYKAAPSPAPKDDADLTDDEISKMSPLMQASARARRKAAQAHRAQTPDEQAKAIKGK